MIDVRWLDILKASGPKAAALAVASFLLLLASILGWIPPLDAWAVQLAAAVFAISICLAAASAATVANEFCRPRERLARWLQKRADRRAVRDYIPHMTEEERAIVAYLLARNQRMFRYTIDGGRAATLLARGIVRIAGNQYVDPRRVPFIIPNHIWKVLAENRDAFPYTPPAPGQPEPYPWGVHWMAR